MVAKKVINHRKRSSARNYADIDSLIEIIRESKLLITY